MNNNNIIDSSDWQNVSNNEDIADLNDEPGIQYSDDCTNDYLSDNCILRNYLLDKNSLNCSSDNYIVKKYISERNNSNSSNAPMYSFTITSDDIKKIRKYNESNRYNDFSFKCNEQGKECLSDFLTNWINEHNDKDYGYSCFDKRLNGEWCES